MPDTGMVVSLPSLHAAYSNNGFRLDEMGARGWGFKNIRLNYESLQATTTNDARAIFSTQVPLVMIGKRFATSYISIGFNEQLWGAVRYSGDAIQLGADLNTNNLVSGSLYDLSSLAYQLIHYRDLHVSVAHQINRFTGGFRLHYISGLENHSSSGSGIMLEVDDEGNSLLTEGVLTLWSGGRRSVFGDDPYRIRGTGNRGFALDIGGSYFVSPQLSISASIINLGGITWTRRVKNNIINSTLEAPEETINSLIDDQMSTDSFDVISYRTFLPISAYISGTYKFNPTNSVQVLFSPLLAGNGLSGLPLALSYYRQITEGLEMTVAYSINNRRYFNLGAGLVFTNGPVQLFLISDNLPSLIKPSSQYNIHLSAGMNLLFNQKVKTVDSSKQAIAIITPDELEEKSAETIYKEKPKPYVTLSGTINTESEAPLPGYFHLDTYRISANGKQVLVRTGRQIGNNYKTYLERGFDFLLVFKVDNFPYFELSISADETQAAANEMNIDVVLKSHSSNSQLITSPNIEETTEIVITNILPIEKATVPLLTAEPSDQQSNISKPEPIAASIKNKPEAKQATYSGIIPLFESFGGSGNVIAEITNTSEIRVLEQTTSQWWMVAYKSEIGWIAAEAVDRGDAIGSR